MQRITTYKEQSRILLTQAQEELGKGDLPQASEKGWGAAAQMVKAIADERGWRHFSHRSLQSTVSALRQETGDTELSRLFAFGESLHVNFYENGYTDVVIEDYLQQVERFVEKAEGLLNGAS